MRVIGAIAAGGGFAVVMYEVFLLAPNPFVCVIAVLATIVGAVFAVEGGGASGA